jgi:membrane fusion protein (multidrug efflux system)
VIRSSPSSTPTIIDPNPVEVEFSVPEEHLAKLALGRPVSASVPSYPDDLFTGTVTYIEPEVLPDTRSVRLKATIANDDRRLRPGQFATVRAVLAVHAGAVLVPEEAVVPQGAATWVYVVESGHALQRKVSLGVRRVGYVEITGGLEGTETIVVNGQLRLHDGAPVHTVAAEATQG